MQFQSAIGTITYTDEGTGPPVLFLHALGRSASDWSTVTSHLAEDHRCIAIDFPGHGESEHTGNYSCTNMADSVLDLIAELDLGRFSIVAHSMGATIAWIVAPDLAARIDALVVEDTPVPTDRHTYPEAPAQPPQPVDYDWQVRRQVFAELNDPDPKWRQNVTGLAVPTLLVTGTADDQEMLETAALLTDARVVTIPVGHWIHQEATAEYLDTVRPFLAAN